MKTFIQFKNEIFSFVLVLMILIIYLVPSLKFNYFTYGNFKIEIANFIALLLFLLVCLLKNFQKLSIIVILNRFDLKELIYSYSYYFNMLVLFLLMLYLNYLNFIFCTIIILLEIMILITTYYATSKGNLKVEALKFIKVKEVLYICLMILLFLGNYPFSIYSIPMTSILVVAYILLQSNIVYLMYKNK